MSKIIFMKYLPPVRPKFVPKIKNAQDVLKSCASNISSVPISILMSKMIFIKYVPPIRPKLVPNLKVLRIYRNT